MGALEKTVKAKLKGFLKEQKAYNVWPVQSGYGASTLDCIAGYRGIFLGIECKREVGGVASHRQKLTMIKIDDAGCLCWIEDRTDLTLTRLVFKTLDEGFPMDMTILLALIRNHCYTKRLW